MVVALDIETYDPELKVFGPGGVRENGFVIGVAICDPSKNFLTHEKPALWNRNTWWTAERIDLLSALDVDVVGANILYDLEWIYCKYGFKPTKKIIDIQLAERILDPNADKVRLEVLAQKYLGETKGFDEIEEWWSLNKPKELKKNKKAIENLHRVPEHLVAKYAMKDAELAYRIWHKQEELLKKDKDLLEAFDRESQVLKILFEIRLAGVPFSTTKAKEIQETLAVDIARVAADIEAVLKTGGDFNKRSKVNKELLATYCESLGIKIQRTKTKLPKLTKAWLAKQDGQVFKDIVRKETMEKLRNDFVVKLQKFVTDGKIHCLYHPFKTDENGTGTGRLAATKPNLQQIPIRDKVYGKMIRSQFIAPEGYVWVKADFSQQEPRCFIHYACEFEFEAAEKIRDMYINNPDTDFYKVIVELCHGEGYTFITRDDAKMLMLATMYGMGAGKLAGFLVIPPEKLVVTEEVIDNIMREWEELRKKGTREDAERIAPEWLKLQAAKKLLHAFKNTFPFIPEMSNLLAAQARENYHIVTIGKRKIIFDRYELRMSWERRAWLRDNAPNHPDLETFKYPELLAKFENDRAYIDKNYTIAFTYKALNAEIQGSCADITKQAMINVYAKGFLPIMQVHDELSFLLKNDGFIHTNVAIIKHEMENTFKMYVPMKVDIEMGPSWGEVVDYEIREEVLGTVKEKVR